MSKTMSEKIDDLALTQTERFIKGNRVYAMSCISQLPTAQAMAVTARILLFLPPCLQGSFVEETAEFAQSSS